MKVCIPVAEYRGLESPVYGHFGSADCFALVDTETMAVERLSNRDRAHVHGACSPVKALAGAKPNAILVGGIGTGALIGLRQAGITVCRAPSGTVADAVRLFKAGELEELNAEATCAGHAGQSACHCQH
jgi:predicted Fe-Mo cluster-binding NifX family protein